MNRALEYSDEKSNKFWKITVSSSVVTIVYGKIGTSGRETIKEFDDDKAANSFAEKKFNEKLKKGYQEVKITTDQNSITDSTQVTISDPTLKEALNLLQSENWVQLEQILDQVSDIWQELFERKFNEMSAFVNILVDSWKLIKGTEFESEYAQQILYLSKRQKEISEVPSKMSEIVALELGESINVNADDGDQFTQGFAYGLFLFPESNNILDLILNEVVDHDYICEGAIENAIETSKVKQRKLLLKSLDILSSFHISKNCDSDKTTMEYFLRDIKWAKQKFNEFSLSDLKKGEQYITSKEKFSKYWTFPSNSNMVEVETLFFLLDEGL